MTVVCTKMFLKSSGQSLKKGKEYIHEDVYMDPFGLHMYTETEVSILVQHLRKKTPVTLYLDATGNVVSKVPS